MIITIPTYGRANNQITYRQLPENLQKLTYLVVQHSERDLYPNYPNKLVLPDDIRDIATTRDYIVAKWPRNRVIMLDDDLTFAVRRQDDKTKFVNAGPHDVGKMIDRIEELLGYYVHVGVSGREGANRNTSPVLYNTRMMRVLAYDTYYIDKYKLKFGPGTFMCDFYMTLELLTLEHPNVVLNDYVHNQPGSNTAGGCSTQRTPELQKAAAEFLANKFPDYVKMVKKLTKTSWGGVERYDVRVQWKRAFEGS